MDIKAYLKSKAALVEEALSRYMLPEEGVLAEHIRAMRYSLFAGGKRVRPILAIATAEALGADAAALLPAACALECIHTYSLIHDDLPAMDNDDLRRGKPTNHVVFGEAGAILAGDGLLSFAFELLAHPDLEKAMDASAQVSMVRVVSRAIGPLGMVGGQALDLAAEGREIPFDHLKYIHACKTGALITGSVQVGALFGSADSTQYEALTSYGGHVGLAFQIVDDLLDVVGDTKELGKQAGADQARNKATYPAFFGVERTREMARQAVDAAVDSLASFDQRAEPLRALARYIYERRK
ncbi:MAG: polyprenyl synthetase family protein [Thermodesulfobacteriota bacterium]